MNKRIEELAAIAKKQAQEKYAHKMIPGLFSAAEFNQIFAELIIEECSELTLDFYNDDHYKGWLDYREEIKKHFGIENER